MENLNFDWKTDKFAITSGFLGALAAVSMLFIMLASGFNGYQLYWIILGAAAAAIGYLVVNKTLAKYTAGIAFLAVSLGGALVHLFIGYPGFEYLMVTLLFITVVGLFGHFFAEKDDTIRSITALSAGLYALCHLLPFNPASQIPLQTIFKHYDFINALLALILFIAAIAVAGFIALEKMKAELPVGVEMVLRISFFTMAGVIVLQFLIRIFQSPSFGTFISIFFSTMSMWAIGIIAGLSFFLMKEGREEKVLNVNLKV